MSESLASEAKRRTPLLTIALGLCCGLLGWNVAGCNSQCLPGFIKIQEQCVPYDMAKGLCAKVCEARTCGDDGCGGSCGECTSKDTPFCVDGACVAECQPKCDGKICGDDGCGGSCGNCDGECNPRGTACAPKAFVCKTALYADNNACHCGCGAPDPDCEVKSRPVFGCSEFGAACDEGGNCIGGVSESDWKCAKSAYNDGEVCNCGCGAPDPDCAARPGAPVFGCEPGSVCGEQGTCEPSCTGNCTGKACGDDGCGRSCGACPDDAAYCNDGVCGATCVPKCTGRSCGDNGCGGTCGECAAGQACQNGQCNALSAELSCVGKCGGQADDGCSCAQTCIGEGNCCLDAELACGCFPKCTSKVCGDDGCGGSCGSCETGQKCSVSQQCEDDPCLPDPCNGHGTCSQQNGACSCATAYAGGTCAACADGYEGYPDCVLNLCSFDSCSHHGVCEPATGACTCESAYTGPNCEACSAAGVYPACL